MLIATLTRRGAHRTKEICSLPSRVPLPRRPASSSLLSPNPPNPTADPGPDRHGRPQQQRRRQRQRHWPGWRGGHLHRGVGAARAGAHDPQLQPRRSPPQVLGDAARRPVPGRHRHIATGRPHRAAHATLRGARRPLPAARRLRVAHLRPR